MARIDDVSRTILALLVAASLWPASTQAQALAGPTYRPDGAPESSLDIVAQDTVTIAPGARYGGAGWLKRRLLGERYRSLWATPLRVPVIDLELTGGGLTAERRGGGQQTRSLRFRAADGTQFVFRSLDKDPAAILKPELRGTVAQDILQDQVSAAHPAGPLMAAAALQAVGVPTGTPTLVMLPVSERLGAFGDQFAGMLGYIEARTSDGGTLGEGQPRFEDVVNSEDMMARLREHPSEQVDAGRYLAARLVDFFLGDWDRHRGQWHWGRRAKHSPWEPIPNDRDQALVRFDGLLLSVARQRVAPQLVKFGPDVPVSGLTWNGRDLDRLILPRLDRAAWDSVTADVVARLDDVALDHIVSVVPAVFGKAQRTWLRATLAERRRALGAASAKFRAQIERTPDLLLTDAPERIELSGSNDGGLRVKVSAAGSDQATLDHTYTTDETKEVRIYGLGGADSIGMVGAGGRVKVRFIGGAGRDGLIGGRIPRLTYVEGGASWREPPGEDTPPPPRDWGSRTQQLPTLGFASDQGLLAGYWLRKTSYGFRRFPHATSWSALAQVSTSTGRPGLVLSADVQARDSVWFVDLAARATGVERMRWYGLGNETVEQNDRDVYRVDNWRVQLEPTLNVRLTRRLVAGAGPTVRYTSTTAEPGRLLTVDQPYGSGDFGQAGAIAFLRWEQPDRPSGPGAGVTAEIGGRVMPALWDVAATYGAVHATLATRLTAGGALQPSLALGLRGEKIFGTAPFFDAATIGGAASLRGFSEQRFRGDGALVANSEARIRVARATVVLPADIGVLGIADVGRVFVDGQSSDRWHAAAGGGLWISWLGGTGSLAFSVVASDERTMLYAGTRFPY